MSDCDNKQVDDWNEATFLGAAVGILVTVSLAAAAAVVLVLVRNRVSVAFWSFVLIPYPNRWYMFQHGPKSIVLIYITTVIEHLFAK